MIYPSALRGVSALIAALGIGMFTLGCSSSSTSGTSGSTTDAGSSTTGDSGGGTPPTTHTSVNGCDNYAPGDKVEWGFSAFPPKTCLQVRTGTSVTWTTTEGFTTHPLQALGGDSPNPIQETKTGNSVTFKFDKKGTFGFHCEEHSTMKGAVEVYE